MPELIPSKGGSNQMNGQYKFSTGRLWFPDVSSLPSGSASGEAYLIAASGALYVKGSGTKWDEFLLESL